MDDPWRLDRYVTAQERGGTYQRAVAELRAGAKVSHWMWFVFPQIAGLGMSAMSREYAISSIAEARAYLDHPVLGPRLVECAGIVAGTEGRSAEQIFGPVDAMKLRSSMTLFAAADMAAASVDDGGTSVNEGGTGGAAASGGEGQAPDESRGNVFRAVLAKFFGGAADEATLARLLRHRRPRHEDGSVARRRLGRPRRLAGRFRSSCRHRSGSRSTSSALSAASRRAVSLPIPLVAPVTRQDLPDIVSTRPPGTAVGTTLAVPARQCPPMPAEAGRRTQP
jgi:uncharacterized protein (DUF1810 family)